MNFFLLFLIFILHVSNFHYGEIFFKTHFDQNWYTSLSFLWSNSIFFYLLFFISIIFIKNYWIKITYFSCLFIIKYISYMYEFNSFFLNSNYFEFYNKFLFKFNSLLINTMNYIHPPFFFFLTSMVLITYMIIFLIRTRFFQLLFVYKFKFKLLLVLVLFFIFIGAWWAFQEQTWGGWWNWDSSEVFGLIILIFFLLIYHYWFWNLNYFYIKYSINNLFWFFLIILISLQLNFQLSSHNFGTRFFFFFNNNMYLIELIYLVFYLYFNSSRRANFIYKNFKSKPSSFNFSLSLFWKLIVVLYAYKTFNPVFNYFFFILKLNPYLFLGDFFFFNFVFISFFLYFTYCFMFYQQMSLIFFFVTNVNFLCWNLNFFIKQPVFNIIFLIHFIFFLSLLVITAELYFINFYSNFSNNFLFDEFIFNKFYNLFSIITLTSIITTELQTWLINFSYFFNITDANIIRFSFDLNYNFFEFIYTHNTCLIFLSHVQLKFIFFIFLLTSLLSFFYSQKLI